MLTFEGLGRAHPSSPKPGTGSDLEADNLLLRCDRKSLRFLDEVKIDFGVLEMENVESRTELEQGAKAVTWLLKIMMPTRARVVLLKRTVILQKSKRCCNP